MKKVDTCGLSFKALREEGRYYVDKSLLIRDVLDSDNRVFLFTRPRRFAKTTNLSMMDAFFNIRYHGNDWFDGLEISDHHEFDDLRNSHPVINLDLASTSTTCYDHFLTSMASCILVSLKEHSYVFDSPVLDDDDRRFIDHVMAKRMTREDIVSSISVISGILERHHGRKVVVLIDEYDSAVSDHLGSDSHRDVMRLLGDFMEASFRNNDNVLLACIMGIIPFEKDVMFPDIDGLHISDVFSHDSEDMFGFTESEVRDVLTDQGRQELLLEVMEWYGGYRFGDMEVCNPFAVMCYVSRGMKPGPYWSESGGLVIPGMSSDDDAVGIGDFLVDLDRRACIVDPPRTFGHSETGDRESRILMMITTGYLSATPVGDGTYRLSVPNKDVRKVMSSIHPEQ